VGRRIDLEDFTAAQLGEFRQGLLGVGDPGEVLSSVFDWTHGHPYMAQCIFKALIERGVRSGEERARVDAEVNRLFLLRGRVDDQNLAYADRHFDEDVLDPKKPAMLRLYRQLLTGERVAAVVDDSVQQGLRLTGMVATRV